MFKDIKLKAPTKYRDNIESVKRYRTVIDKIIIKRDNLVKDKEQAKKRNKEIPSEIARLSDQVKRLLDKNLTETIRKDIKALEREQEELKALLDIDVKEVIKNMYMDSNIEELKNKAKVEHLKAQSEIQDYWKELKNTYDMGLTEYANNRDYNLFKMTSKTKENLEKYILK